MVILKLYKVVYQYYPVSYGPANVEARFATTCIENIPELVRKRLTEIENIDLDQLYINKIEFLYECTVDATLS